MPTVVGVSYSEYGRIHYLDPSGHRLSVGDRVLVELDCDAVLATVIVDPHKRQPTECLLPLTKVARVATEDDERQVDAMERRREKALRVCRQKVAELRLDMRLVDAVCSFDGKQITFYFSAENRIDFRTLVKELSSVFRTRIQMEQIGVRDEAGRLGGCGSCGRELCCSSWLPQFYPVSIKMAKEQWLSLNPAKISGVCGRLLCCLRYEHQHYCEANARMPKPGSRACAHGVHGKVLEVNPISERVNLALETGTRESFPLDEVEFDIPAGKPPRGARPPAPEKLKPPKEEPPSQQAQEQDSKESPPPAQTAEAADKPPRKRRRRRRRPKPEGQGAADQAGDQAKDAAAREAKPQTERSRPKPPPRQRKPRGGKGDNPPAKQDASAPQAAGQPDAGAKKRRRRRRRRRPQGAQGKPPGNGSAS